MKQYQERFYSDEEINKLAEWLEDLTIEEVFYLKQISEALSEAENNKEKCLWLH